MFFVDIGFFGWDSNFGLMVLGNDYTRGDWEISISRPNGEMYYV